MTVYETVASREFTGRLPEYEKISKKTASVLLWRVAGAGLLFLMHTAISNHIGLNEYGIFSLATTVAGMIGLIAPLGWPTAVIRFIAEYQEKQDWHRLKGMFLRAYQTALIISLLLSSILFLVSLFLYDSLALSLKYAAVLIPISSFVALRRQSLRGLNAIFSSLIPDEIILPLLVISGVYIFGPASAGSAFRIYFALTIVVMLLSMGLLISRLKPIISNVRATYDYKAWIKVALPMLAGGLSQIMLNRIDIIMIGAMRSSLEVGLYSASNRYASLVVFGLGAVAIVVAPILSKLYNQGKIDEFHLLIRKGAILSGIFGIVSCGIAFLYAPELMSLFGEKFSQGADLLRILVIGQLINALTGPVGFGLLLTGGERKFALLNMCALLGNILGNLLVIPIFGSKGAAVVSALTIMTLNISLFHMVRKIR
jgi:O-antigen/teichoic acid export membrane protein